MDQVNNLFKPLSVYGDKVPQIADIAKKAKVESGVILGAGLLVVSIVVMILFGATILSVMITVIYPSIQSIKALETEGGDDDKYWLTYWIIFGVFSLLDEFGGIVLSLIPFYFYIKLGFFVFLMHPKTQGAKTVYDNLVGPLIKQHKEKIQKFIDEIKGAGSDLAKEGIQAAKKELNDPNNLMKAMNAANEAKAKLDTLQ